MSQITSKKVELPPLMNRYEQGCYDAGYLKATGEALTKVAALTAQVEELNGNYTAMKEFEETWRERAECAESELAATRKRGEELKDKEAGRWQDAIYKILVKHCGDSIDGGGCDSGDPLDFTLDEIGQAIGMLKDRAEKAEAELAQVTQERDTFDAEIDRLNQKWAQGQLSEVERLKAELAALRSYMQRATSALASKEWADSLSADPDAAAMDEQIGVLHGELAAMREGATTFEIDWTFTTTPSLVNTQVFESEADMRKWANMQRNIILVRSMKEVITRERILDAGKGEG